MLTIFVLLVSLVYSCTFSLMLFRELMIHIQHFVHCVHLTAYFHNENIRICKAAMKKSESIIHDDRKRIPPSPPTESNHGMPLKVLRRNCGRTTHGTIATITRVSCLSTSFSIPLQKGIGIPLQWDPRQTTN